MAECWLQMVVQSKKSVQVATDVIAVFKQAAGANADQILKRIADYGVAGRKTALDADMFTSPGRLI